MGSKFKKSSLLLLLVLLLAGGLYVYFQDDPAYFVAEKIHLNAWSRFDSEIARVSRQTGVDFYLIKAVIWQESRFGPEKVGGAGERGLMQVTEAAAADWAKANAVNDFNPEELFKPEVNIAVGTWYLRRALDRYQDKDHPLSFALSEYNAGRTRVKRWMGQPAAGEEEIGADEMKQKSFDSTRAYVESIEHRYESYKKAARREG